MYAGRRRRKPLPRATRPGPADGGSSNPSKRHRERLNRELERLAGLLPFPPDVVAGLDKLSVLRLSAGFLRARSFFSVALKNHSAKDVQKDGDCGHGPAPGSAAVPEGELLLQALNGFVLVVTSEGLIFYSSHTIQDYLGFHQTDVMHQSIFELIHTEDQPEFRRNLHWALHPPQAPEGEPSPQGGNSLGSSAATYKPDQLPPDSSSFLERSFVCRFRCLLDNSSGFLALNLQGRLKFLHGQNKRSEDGSVLPPQLALFAISTPLQPPPTLQLRSKNMIFRTKHKLDFTPLACDAKGRIVLGYTEAELRTCGTGYQFVHAADTLYCAENHVRMMKTGESGLTVFRLLTKEKRWKWVQANARLVYKSGKPEYIVVTQRPLVDEEGGEHLRKRSMHLPFTFTTGEALLYQSTYPLPGFPDPFQSKGKASKSKKTSCSHGGCSQQNGVEPSSLLGAVMRQDKAGCSSHPAPTPNPSCSSSSHLKDVSMPDAGRHAWSMGAAPVSSRGSSLKEGLLGLQQEDPLLATLDSLSIKSDESCSNNELFSALEGLGLNTEDLELLLLDEKMVMVNVDPQHSPSLSNSLASSQILSSIHSPPLKEHHGGQEVCALPGPSLSPWDQPLHAVPGLLPEEEGPWDGSQWGPAGEEALLWFLQPAQGTPWDRAPGAPCPGEPPGAHQLKGHSPATQPVQEDAQRSLCLPSPCQDRVGLPGLQEHHPSLLNGLRGHSPGCPQHLLPSPSPWQDGVSPLLGSAAQPGFYGSSPGWISQHQGEPFSPDGWGRVGTASSSSQDQMPLYPSFLPPSCQLIPEKQQSPVPSVPQQPFLSSATGPFRSTGSQLETGNSYGMCSSAPSQEGRHRTQHGHGLPSSPLGLPQDQPVLGASLAPPWQPQPGAEALPDHPRASSGGFCL